MHVRHAQFRSVTTTSRLYIKTLMSQGRNSSLPAYEIVSLGRRMPSHELLFVQFLAWDTLSRRRINLIGRKDDGDQLIAHEFDYSVEKQVITGK